jgi:hypothetical protein
VENRPKSEKIRGERRKLHKKALQELFPSTYIISMSKERRIR